jgi:hypothetical protein
MVLFLPSSKDNQMIDTSQFYGTDAYHKFGLFPDVATDGAMYLAEKAGAFWLLDEIVARLREMKYHAKDYFVVAKLTVSDSTGVLTLDDGNGNVFLTKKIGFTDYPDPEVTLFVSWNGDRWVLMVPSEY